MELHPRVRPLFDVKSELFDNGLVALAVCCRSVMYFIQEDSPSSGTRAPSMPMPVSTKATGSARFATREMAPMIISEIHTVPKNLPTSFTSFRLRTGAAEKPVFPGYWPHRITAAGAAPPNRTIRKFCSLGVRARDSAYRATINVHGIQDLQ